MKLTLNARLIYFRLCLSLILLILALTTACNSSTEEESVENSDVLTIYTALPEAQVKAYLDEFHKEYPDIEVNPVRDSIANIQKKLLDEQKNPQADVIWGLTATNLLILEWRDMLKGYTPKGLERVQRLFKDPALPPHWVGINILMSVFCVNPELIEKNNLPMPESWQDLLNPIYADQIVMSSPLSTGTGYVIVSSILDTQGEVEGWEYLDNLHKNIKYYSNTAASACEVVGKGEYAIALSADSQAVIQINAGNPVVAVFASEGTSWEMRANALVKKKKIKPAAITFLDWALSDHAMQAYAKDAAVISVDLGLPIPKGYPADIREQLLDNDFPWAAANNQNILTEWERRYADKLEPQK